MVMRRSWRLGLCLVGAGALALGCDHGHGSRCPPDPLLLSKRPIESRPAAGPQTSVARHEPPAPEKLALALAAAHPEAPSGEPASQPKTVPAIPTSLRRDDTGEH
jgi:hypothetical protein